jgi:hypothetical protein
MSLVAPSLPAFLQDDKGLIKFPLFRETWKRMILLFLLSGEPQLKPVSGEEPRMIDTGSEDGKSKSDPKPKTTVTAEEITVVMMRLTEAQR